MAADHTSAPAAPDATGPADFRFDVPGWAGMDDDERVAAVTGRDDALWLCEAGFEGDHASLVRGWATVVEHYAKLMVDSDATPKALDEARIALARAPLWNFGSTCAAKYSQEVEDGWVTYTLVTRAALGVPAARRSGEDGTASAPRHTRMPSDTPFGLLKGVLSADQMARATEILFREGWAFVHPYHLRDCPDEITFRLAREAAMRHLKVEFGLPDDGETERDVAYVSGLNEAVEDVLAFAMARPKPIPSSWDQRALDAATAIMGIITSPTRITDGQRKATVQGQVLDAMKWVDASRLAAVSDVLTPAGGETNNTWAQYLGLRADLERVAFDIGEEDLPVDCLTGPRSALDAFVLTRLAPRGPSGAGEASMAGGEGGIEVARVEHADAFWAYKAAERKLAEAAERLRDAQVTYEAEIHADAARRAAAPTTDGGEK